MYDDEDNVTTHITHHFTLPRLEWQELRSIYRQWVHIEDDPLYKSFMQQGKHMTIDLLTNMQKNIKNLIQKHSAKKQTVFGMMFGILENNKVKKLHKDYYKL